MAVPTVWSGAPESWSPVPAPGALRERDRNGPGAWMSRSRRSRTGARRERPGAAWSAPGAPWSAPGAFSRRSRLPEAGAHSISSRRACPWNTRAVPAAWARPASPSRCAKDRVRVPGHAQRDASKCAPGRSPAGAPLHTVGSALERHGSATGTTGERTRERSLEPGSSGRAGHDGRRSHARLRCDQPGLLAGPRDARRPGQRVAEPWRTI